MAISTYQKNGETFFRAYVHERSKLMKGIRVQKTRLKIKTEAEARRVEKLLMRLAFEEISVMESKGITWKDLIHRWEVHSRSCFIGKDFDRDKIVEVVKALYKHTYVWLNKRVLELGRADGRYIVNVCLEKGLSPTTIKILKGKINKVWNWGVEERLIAGNTKSPVHGLLVEKGKNKYKPILTLPEVRTLLYEAEIRNHPWKDIWAVAILTGMRHGELVVLTWDDVDLENRIIRITKSYNYKLKEPKSTKNGEWRNAHISDDLREILIRLKATNEQDKYVLPRVQGFALGHAAAIIRQFANDIGIDKHITLHTLRACFATHSLTSGAEPTQVMKMGGWADFKTFQIYIRMAGVDVKGVTDNLRVTPKLAFEDNVIELKI